MIFKNRLIALVMAILVPPIGAWLARGLGLGTFLSVLGFVAANIIFWGFAALPGFALYLLTIFHACILAIFYTRSKGTSS